MELDQVIKVSEQYKADSEEKAKEMEKIVERLKEKEKLFDDIKDKLRKSLERKKKLLHDNLELKHTIDDLKMQVE